MKKIMAVKRKVLHTGAHFDEDHALWLAMRVGGETAFPGITKAPLEFWDTYNQNTSPEEYMANGYLLIGIGDGPFNDKKREGGRKEGKCSAILMAEALGVHNDPRHEKMLKYSLLTDTQPSMGVGDLASHIKRLNQNHPDLPRKAVDWAFDILDEHYTQQQRFFTTVKKEYESVAVEEGIRSYKGKNVILVTISTSTPDVVAYARSEHGGNAGVLIKFDPNVGPQIHFDQRLSLGTVAVDLIRCLRIEEGNLKQRDWDILGQAGQVCPEDRWYGVGREGGGRTEITIVANGTLSHARPRSRIPDQRIMEIVKMCVGQEFEPSRAPQCTAGVCSSSHESKCPWYQYGLRRCAAVRWNERGPVVATL